LRRQYIKITRNNEFDRVTLKYCLKWGSVFVEKDGSGSGFLTRKNYSEAAQQVQIRPAPDPSSFEEDSRLAVRASIEEHIGNGSFLKMKSHFRLVSPLMSYSRYGSGLTGFC
jgi:hypothetical protein